MVTSRIFIVYTVHRLKIRIICDVFRKHGQYTALGTLVRNRETCFPFFESICT